MELVGGIKREFQLVKSEAVEITADDIADDDDDDASLDDNAKFEGPRVEEEVVRGNGEVDKNGQVEPKARQAPEILLLNGVVIRVDPKNIELRDDLRYHCLLCDTYSSETCEGAKKHIRHKHYGYKGSIKQCPHCPYQTPWYLDSHILYHHTDPSKINWFYCDQCDKKFRKKSLLQRHITNVHLQIFDWPRCETCQKMFKTSMYLRNHINSVHIKKTDRFKCKKCDFKTHSKPTFNYHVVKNHTKLDDLKMLECSKCDFKTKFSRDLDRHKRIRHNARTFQCHQCGFCTTSDGSMKLHMIYHKEDKESDLKYRCPECPYKTYRHYSYNVHLRTHKKPEELTMFRCYHCPFESKRKDNLKTHIFKHEIFKAALSCAHCDYRTRSKEALAKHLRGHKK